MGHSSTPWQDTDFVLAHFAGTVQAARTDYGRFVRDGLSQGRRPDLLGGGLRGSRHGWQHAAQIERGREAWAFDERILGSSEFVTKMLTELPDNRVRATRGEPGEAVPELLSLAGTRFTVGSSEIAGNSHRPAALTARVWVI